MNFDEPSLRPDRFRPWIATSIALLTFVAVLLCTTGWRPLPERLRTGADRIFEEPFISWINGKRVGLVTNQTGVDRDLNPIGDLLSGHSECTITTRFAPEHGMDGTVQAGEQVASSSRVFSLYGKTLRPTPAMLTDVDVLIFDIQDVGARFYTYVSTMLECMKAAASNQITLIILDRPNPIDATRVEGPVLEESSASFVGVARVPIRHGMTMGEMALLLKSDFQLDLDLRIVPLSGWERFQWYSETELQWIAPSPNMPTLNTAAVYPGFCLVEGTNLSEGRGTTQPFELVGSPWLDSGDLSRVLNHLGIPGVYFRPQSFRPTFSKYEGQFCRGIQIHVLDRSKFDPIQAALHLLREIRLRHPDQLQFNDSFFDRLAGNSWVREMLEKGDPVKSIAERWQPDLREFKRRREEFLLY